MALQADCCYSGCRLLYYYTECHYWKCHDAECYGAPRTPGLMQLGSPPLRLAVLTITINRYNSGLDSKRDYKQTCVCVCV
jgi:hypothetical protein